MKLTRWMAEAFYSPDAFFRFRKDHPQSLIWTQFFSLGAYVLMISQIFRVGGFQASFFQLFFFSLMAFALGFIKTGLFTAILNLNTPKVSLKEVWMLQALGLFPIYLAFPMLNFFAFSQGVSLAWILLAFAASAVVRIRLYRKFYPTQAHFVWIASLIQGILILGTLFLVFSAGTLFLSRMAQELFQNLF